MKPFAFTLLAALFLVPYLGSAQINDCADAQVVCSDAFFIFNPIGPGLDDYADPDNFPGCIVALEQNSAWYYFEIDPLAPPDLELGFIINPLGGYGEDYDWALYGPDVDCGDLGFPIRCSSSSFMCGFCPETGMGMGTTDFTEGPGTGDGFVSTLIVQPGQGFYLMIDNWLGTENGFTMEWTGSAAPWLNCAAEPPCAVNAFAGEDIDACEGDMVTLNGSGTAETYSWSGSNGGTLFLSDPNIPNPTVTLPPGFTGTITYTLSMTEDTCTAEDEMLLTVEPLPVVSINPIGPFCQEDTPQFLIGNPPGGAWGGAVTAGIFNPTLLGPGIHTVTYTYTDQNLCSNVAAIDIEVYESPEATIDPDPAEFCDSEGSLLLTVTGDGGGGGYQYNWNTPSGMDVGSTYTATISGPHNVTVTDANGCSSSAVVTVTAHPNPEVEIIDPGPICNTVEFFTLTANLPGGEFSGSIVNPDGDMNPNMITPGTYNVSYEYFDANNCPGSDNQIITIVAVPEAIAGNNGPLCNGEQILLTGETNDTGMVVSYLWSGPNGYMSNLQNPTDATMGGNYNLQVFVDGCPSLPAVTTVVALTSPDAMASNGGPYCNGGTIQLFGGTSTMGNVVTYAWLGPNGYTSGVQNPTDAIDAGIYSLIINVDGCNSPAALTDVIFSTPPDAMASNTGPYCEGETIEVFGSTTANGNVITYNWSGPNGYVSNAQNPGDVDTTGLYELVINVDGCNSDTVSTAVTINTVPQPLIAGQDTFCTGYSATLDAGMGYAGYVWNDASQNQVLEVFSPGTYTVTVTDVNGCTASASHAVAETASLTPVITGPLDFCEGASTVLDAGAGFVSYVWSTGEMTQTIQVASGGNYGVIVTDADGCTGSSNITTTEHAFPLVMIGGSTTYCIGGYTVLDAGPGFTNYMWSNDSTTQTITVSAPGIYGVDVIDLYGCPGSGSVTITESTSLSPVITGSTAFCENGSTTLNAGSGFANYIWSDGSVNQTLTVNTTGAYSVTVSDNQGCSGEATVNISEVSPPSAGLQPDAEVCNTAAGGSLINLYSLVLSGDMTGTWQDADNSGAIGLFSNLNFANVPAGNYTFTYTTNSAIAPCPETSYPAEVTVLDCACPDVLFFNTDPLCNESDVLDLSTIENTAEDGVWTLIQTPAGSNPAVLNGSLFNATSGDPGQYIFQFTLLNQPPPGCPSDFQVSVGVDPAVDAGVALSPAAFCFEEDELVSLGGLLSGADANGIWTETSTTPSQGGAFNAAPGSFETINQLPGTYTFAYTLNSSGACPDDAAAVSVVINPLPTVLIANAGEFNCETTVQALDAAGSSVGPEYDIVWTGPGILSDGNQNTLNPNIDAPGAYTLVITNTLTGCTDDALVTVAQNTAAPTGALINDSDPACFGDQNGTISIMQVIGGTAPFVYSINNSSFSPNSFFNNLPAGSYDLVLEDANGCLWDTVITLVAPSEINLNVGDDIELELGEEATIQATVSPSSIQIDTLIWSPDGILACFDFACLDGIVSTFNTVTLSATVYDQYGCTDTDALTITVVKDRRLYIPTAFSPNGDGINDIFFVMGSDFQIVKIKKFRVFSRWGDLLYEALDFLPNDQSKGWDGRFRSELLNPGVFVYAAEIEYIDGLVEQVTGDVTIVK